MSQPNPNTELSKQVIELVAELVEPKLREWVTHDAELLQSKLVDSFGLIQLVSDIEAKLGVAVRTEDMTLEHFSTVQGIVALVQSYRDGAA